MFRDECVIMRSAAPDLTSPATTLRFVGEEPQRSALLTNQDDRIRIWSDRSPAHAEQVWHSGNENPPSIEPAEGLFKNASLRCVPCYVSVLTSTCLDLRERGHRAFLVEIAARCAADADPADCGAIRLDGHAADPVGDVR